jgi:hypothetical protein
MHFIKRRRGNYFQYKRFDEDRAKKNEMFRSADGIINNEELSDKSLEILKQDHQHFGSSEIITGGK